MKQICFFTTLLLAQFLCAQQQYNVKLRENSDLMPLFAQFANVPLTENAKATFRAKYSFLQDLVLIQPLQQKGEMSHYFTLQSETNNLTNLQASQQFEWVEENKKVKLDALQTLPNDDSLVNQWYHSFVKTFEAWEITKGNAAIKIGVIDTGIDYEHPDLQGQLWINTPEDRNQNGTFEPWDKSETRNGKTGDFDGIDQDANGFIDDVIGYDFTDEPRNPIGGDYLFPDADPSDEQSHGTFVSGIMVAKANNGIGGVGLSPECKVLTMRAFGADGGGEDDDIARAIIYAADNGVKVLNMSFGDAYPSQMMHAAIQYAYQKGVIMVASAGNGTGDDLHYPSGFDEVISVSASAQSNGKEFLWQLSSYGWNTVLCAPGSGIYSTTLRDSVDGKWVEYIAASGTSASAPMVSATAALLLSQKNNLTPQQIRGLLANGADDIGETGWDTYTGAGRLNMLRTLQIVGSPNVQIISPANDRGSNQNLIPIIGTVFEPEMKSYSLQYHAGTENSNNWIDILTEKTAQIANDTLAIWDMTGLAEGDYTLRLKVEKSDGFTIEDRIRFVRDKSAPVLTIKKAAQIWDNNERKLFVDFRSDDAGLHKIYFRSNNVDNYKVLAADRITKNGEFLIDKSMFSELQSVMNIEFYIETLNLAGIKGQTSPQILVFEPSFIEQAGVNYLGAKLPMGAFLQNITDFDGDGRKEVMFSRYNSRLSFGKIFTFEYGPTGFQPIDSISLKKALIPKDLKDINSDGLLDLLCSVNDSAFLISQPAPNLPPKNVIWERTGDNLYAARIEDTDEDGQNELIFKDFKDYYILKPSSTGWSNVASLPDITGGYQGSIAPKVLVNDFDGDGKTEILYGDYDGDLIIYEHGTGTNFVKTFIDTTSSYKAGEYLAQGDFNGNGKPEFFVATHPLPGLRNADKEYDPSYIRLRIFEATADNTYQVVWEDLLYDIDTDDYNAATAANIDTDANDELIFTTFPRTYILQFDGQYHFTWFYYGSLTTHHIVGDFNGNGVAEFGIGRGDSTEFFEMDFDYQGPLPVTTLEGIVLGHDTTRLTWQPVNATSYDIYRGEYIPNTSLSVQKIGNTIETTFEDYTATFGKTYLYVLKTSNNNLPITESDYGNPILLRPHSRNKVTHVIALNDKQIQVYFSEKMIDRDSDKIRFRLNYQATPTAILATADKTLILTFSETFLAGNNTLSIDSMLLDAELAILHVKDTSQTFSYTYLPDIQVYLTHWEATSEKEAILYFNDEMNDNALEINNYSIAPFGKIAAIIWANDTHNAVNVRIEEALLGAVGYEVSITVNGATAQNGATIKDGDGNTATFSANADNLNTVYAYPNPYIASKNTLFHGIHFANLTQKGSVSIYTVAGRFVQTVTEVDGNGGVLWDLTDVEGKKVKPGVYLFRATTGDLDNLEVKLGSFTVVEE